jgi:hypothetical protein
VINDDAPFRTKAKAFQDWLFAYPSGGIALVGMSSLSFAYIAESESRPLDRLMSETCMQSAQLQEAFLK